MCEDAFDPLLQYQLKHGHVPDKVYKDLGFPMDRTEDGVDVHQEVGITTKSMQQIKTLTHNFQETLQFLMTRPKKRPKLQNVLLNKAESKRGFWRMKSVKKAHKRIGLSENQGLLVC